MLEKGVLFFFLYSFLLLHDEMHSSLGSSCPLQQDLGVEPKQPLLKATLGLGCIPGYPALGLTPDWALILAQPMCIHSNNLLPPG